MKEFNFDLSFSLKQVFDFFEEDDKKVVLKIKREGDKAIIEEVVE